MFIGNKWLSPVEFFVHSAIDKCFYWLVLTTVLILNRLLTTSVSVYRGYSSILEYVAAGCITGALYKFNMGLAGMAVGGGLGIDNFLYSLCHSYGQGSSSPEPFGTQKLHFFGMFKNAFMYSVLRVHFFQAGKPHLVHNKTFLFR
jgi:hypothetical protein